MKPGYKTSEFWGTMTLVITNVIAMLVVVGMVDASDQQTVTGHITGIVAAIEAFIVNGLALWRYIKSREDLKKDEIEKEVGLLRIQLAEARGSHDSES